MPARVFLNYLLCAAQTKDGCRLVHALGFWDTPRPRPHLALQASPGLSPHCKKSFSARFSAPPFLFSFPPSRNPLRFRRPFSNFMSPGSRQTHSRSPSQAPHTAPGYVLSVDVYTAPLVPYSSVVTSSRILVHLPALRSRPGSILPGDERVLLAGGGGV